MRDSDVIFSGNVYGNGVYFAVDASVASKYSTPDLNSFRFMFYCLVLTGEYTVGTKGCTAPPVKVVEKQEWYNSVCDNIKSPSMFVIFNDVQAYPNYLVIFRYHSTSLCIPLLWQNPQLGEHNMTTIFACLPTFNGYINIWLLHFVCVLHSNRNNMRDYNLNRYVQSA